MKTTRTFFVAFLSLVLFATALEAQTQYYFHENFEGYRGVIKDEAELTVTSNLIYVDKTSTEFGYKFKLEATRLIPSYTGNTFDTTFCAQVLNRGRYRVNAWMISREIDLTNATAPELRFDYACGLHLGVNNFKVMVTESFNGTDPLASTWVDKTDESGLRTIEFFKGSAYPTRFAQLKVDLSAYAGKKVYIAFNNESPLDMETPFNPEEPLHYVDNIIVGEKVQLPTGVYLSENFEAIPGPNDADFNSYNGWWNADPKNPGRNFKKRIDTTMPANCLIIHNNGRTSANAWLVSPIIDLTNTTKPVLSFDFGFGNYVDTTLMSVKITDEFLQGASDPYQYVWENVTAQTGINNPSIVTRHHESVYPKTVHRVTMDLSYYVGYKINVAFNYILPLDNVNTPPNPKVPVYYIDNFMVAEDSVISSTENVSNRNDYFRLMNGQIELNSNVVTAELYSIDGKKVMSGTTGQLSTQQLKGIYLIRIVDENAAINTFKLSL